MSPERRQAYFVFKCGQHYYCISLQTQIQFCQVCKFDEFYEGKGICRKCDSSCVSCFGADKSDCFKCKGYKYQQECFDICPTGYFNDDQTQICTVCNIPFCQQCLDRNKCQVCEKGFQLSLSKAECVLSLADQSKYAYFNLTSNKIVEVEKCPENLEQNEEQHICKYLKVCSQENYIGEFNSNCFSRDEEGLKVYKQEYYLYFYTKKEVQQFSRGSFKYLSYFQNLNTDEDILNMIGISNNLYIIYDKFILIYYVSDNELIQTIKMPNTVLNSKYTQLINLCTEEYDNTYLITYSSSLQNIYVFDLMDMKNIKFEFMIGQNIFEFYIIPQTNKLVVFTELRIFSYSSFLVQSQPSNQQYIGELSQVDWMKGFSLLSTSTSEDQSILFVILNGLSIFIFNSQTNALTRVVANSNYGYVLQESNLIVFVDQSSLYFVSIQDMIQNCSDEINCLNINKDLILFQIQVLYGEFYFVSELNNHIYVSTKNSFQLQVYDKNFKLNSIFSDIQKPIKNMQYFYEQTQSDEQKSFLIISYDNNALILQGNQETTQLYSFCNENNIEVQKIQEYGGVSIDQERHILINAAISMKKNLIILMTKNGQALFQKEFQGDDIINGLQIKRQNFKMLINSSSRLIKIFGLLNSQGQELILIVHYFNFKISPNYEVYFQVEKIISDQIFIAKEKSGSSSCMYLQLVNNEKSKLVTCELGNYQEIKDNNKYIAISIFDAQTNKSILQIINKDTLNFNRQIEIQIIEFNFEFLDTSNIIIISSGKFAKFNIENIQQNELEYIQNSITGKIFKYQVEQQKIWMIIQELKQNKFIFHFLDLLYIPISQSDNKIIPLIALDDTNYISYLSSTNCTFQIFPQSQYNEGTYFQIIVSQYVNSDNGIDVYSNTILTYQVLSNNEIKLADKKRIQQLENTENQLIEGPFSQNKLLFYNQLNTIEQISVLCSYQCQSTDKIDKYQILYKNWKIPYFIKQMASDRIFLDDYYQNTMYSDKWQLLGMEAYQNADRQILANRRIDLFKYPEKQIVFSYQIKVLCDLFTFQMIGIYDTLAICDNMNILIYSLQEIIFNYQKQSQGSTQSGFINPNQIHSFQMNYPENVNQFAFFSQVDPYIYLNLYGVYDFLENKFYEQKELLISDQQQQKKNYLIESKTHLYYTLNLEIYFYDKQKYKQQLNANFSQDSVNFFLNNKSGKLNLERDFIIGLVQFKNYQYIQIIDYSTLTPIKLFYELQKQAFQKKNYYFYCWQYEKLFLRYENQIVGYDFPFSENEQPFFIYKTKTSIPRTCSSTYLVVYQQVSRNIFKIGIILYENQRILKEISLNTDLERINIDLFINQTNVAIIEDKSILVIGNILISTSQSNFYYIFQESKFHYSPSFDVAFIHQQSIEKYIQIIDLSYIFPFVLERFQFEDKFNFRNFYYDKQQNSLPNQNQEGSSDQNSPQIMRFNNGDLIFLNLKLNRICIYNTELYYYNILNIPDQIKSQNLQSIKRRNNQYIVYLNEIGIKSIIVINFDREFYLYDNDQYLKTLNLYDYQEIHVSSQENIVFIYAFKDNQLYYLSIDNDSFDFQIQKINLSLFDFQNFILIFPGLKGQFALIDDHYNLIAQKSIENTACKQQLPQEFNGQIKGIYNLNLIRDQVVTQIIFVNTEKVLSVYNFQCEILWQKNNIFNSIQAIIEDNQTQQIYIADIYFIYVIKYQDLLKKQQESNIISAQFPLQARFQVKLQKLNDNLLVAFSASKIHIFEVQKSFTVMLYISNKDFIQIKQIFLIEEEYLIISDVNKLYIYQILTDYTETEIQSVNQSGGSYSSFSSTSSKIHNYKSNQGDNSEYYFQKMQFLNRKIAVSIYDQAYLSIQILKIETFILEESVFIRIIGADYNNLVDMTKQMKFKNEQNSNQKAFQSSQCIANYVIQKNQFLQIIQYNDIYSLNDGLYNQINFKFLYEEEEENSDEDQQSENQENYFLFIPNSLKFKTKMKSYFVYDLNKNSVYIPPQTIKSTVIDKLKIMNGILKVKQNQQSEQVNNDQQQSSDGNQDFTFDIIQFESLKYIHFENIELQKILLFVNCDQVILENVFISENLKTIVLMQFQNISSITIKNLTVHQALLNKQFIIAENSAQLNITQLTVYGNNEGSFTYPDIDMIENYGWITVLSCQQVVISDINFTNTNIAIDLLFLQDIDQLLLLNFTLLNLNLQFDQVENKLNDINQQIQVNSYELSYIIPSDQNLFDQYINLPVNSNQITSIFRIIYVKTKLKIDNILLEQSNVSMLLHFNKTISLDSSTNQNFSQENESNKLDIEIFNITSNQMEQVQPYICHFSDFIFIEAQNITIQNLNIYQTKCFQSIIRCQNSKVVTIKNSNIILADNINFLFYFQLNQNLIVENVTVQKNNQLHHIFGIFKCSNSFLKNISVYPYIIKNHEQQQKIVNTKIINTAIFIYSEGKEDTNSTAVIEDSIIQYLKSSSSNGTAIQIYQVFLTLSKVNISNNQAGLNGGAIYSKQSSLTLSNSILENNNATFSGGAIFSINSTIQINDNSGQKSLIQFNSAAIGGGIRYFKQTIDQVISKQGCLQSNKAIYYGQDYANFPKKLMIKNSNQNNVVEEVVSSISSAQQEIQFYWLDEQNQKLRYIYKEIDFTNPKYQILQRELIQYSNLLMSSESIWINRIQKEFEITAEIVQADDGCQYIRTKQSYLFKPKGQADIKVRTQVNFPGDEGKRLDQIEIVISIKFRECTFGEIFNSFDRQIYECLECKDNMFSLVKPSSFTEKCLMCPDIAKKCYRNVIEVKDGYWIEPNTTNIYYCFNNPYKCQPGYKNGCSQGGFGPRCESCDYQGIIWEGRGYTKYRDYECKECGEDQDIRLALVPMFIVLFPFFFTYLAHKVTYEAETTLKAYYLKRAGILNLGHSLEDIKFSNIAKFLINYIQIIQTVLYFNFKLPDIFQIVIYFLGNPLQISSYFLDCFFIKNGWTNYIEIVYIRLIWLIINTLLYIVLSNIIAFLVACIKYKKSYYKKDSIKRFIRNSLYYLYFMIYPSLLQQLISILSCEQIGTQKYIYSDNQFLCYSYQHLYIGFPIAVPLIFLLLIKFPIYILFKLKKNKNNFFKISFYLRQRFFFSEYKIKYYYWELVKILQKGLLFIALTVYNESQVTKGALLSVVMIIYIRKLHLSNPYKRLFLNQLDYAASFVQLLCIQLGMIYITTDDLNVQKLMFTSVILFNSLFLNYFIITIFKEKSTYNQDTFIYPCIQRIVQKIPLIQNYLHRSRNAYLSHKGWKKVQITVRKIGYQKLALYFINSKKVQFSNNVFVKDKNASQKPSQSVKLIQPQQSNGTINLQNSKSKSSKKSYFYDQKSIEDIRNITSIIISSDQQLQVIDSIKQSKSIQVPNENALPSQIHLDNNPNPDQTIQKLPETKCIKAMIANNNKI
ncbi:hypothetical protein ABPG74_010140 [Tetrahymena malaccensis]